MYGHKKTETETFAMALNVIQYIYKYTHKFLGETGASNNYWHFHCMWIIISGHVHVQVLPRVCVAHIPRDSPAPAYACCHPSSACRLPPAAFRPIGDGSGWLYVQVPVIIWYRPTADCYFIFPTSQLQLQPPRSRKKMGKNMGWQFRQLCMVT